MNCWAAWLLPEAVGFPGCGGRVSQVPIYVKLILPWSVQMRPGVDAVAYPKPGLEKIEIGDAGGIINLYEGLPEVFCRNMDNNGGDGRWRLAAPLGQIHLRIIQRRI